MRRAKGAGNAGAVVFDAVREGTRVTLKLTHEPEGPAESAGDIVGFITRRVEGDLWRFKEFIEDRQRATGARPGEIHGREAQALPGREHP